MRAVVMEEGATATARLAGGTVAVRARAAAARARAAAARVTWVRVVLQVARRAAVVKES